MVLPEARSGLPDFQATIPMRFSYGLAVFWVFAKMFNKFLCFYFFLSALRNLLWHKDLGQENWYRCVTDMALEWSGCGLEQPGWTFMPLRVAMGCLGRLRVFPRPLDSKNRCWGLEKQQCIGIAKSGFERDSGFQPTAPLAPQAWF